jgi:hypothetical protein
VGHALSHFIGGGITDERIACADVEIDVWERFDTEVGGGFIWFDLSGELEEEPELADFDGLLHEIDSVEVVEDDRLEDEVTLVLVLCDSVEDAFEFREVAIRVDFCACGAGIGEKALHAVDAGFVEGSEDIEGGEDEGS